MRLCGVTGTRCVTCSNCLGYLGVLRDDGLDPCLVRQCRWTQKKQCIVQPTRRFQQEPVARGKIDCTVKLLINSGGLRRIACFLCDSIIYRQQRIDLRLHRVFGSHLRGSALQYQPHFIELDNFCAAQCANDGPDAGAVFDNIFGFKASQSFADGGAR